MTPAPLTAEDRLRATARLIPVGVHVWIDVSDLRDLLSTLDALRTSYDERGAAIDALTKPGAGVRVVCRGRLVFDPRAAHVDKIGPATGAGKGETVAPR